MKLYLVLMLFCCAVTVFAAPVKETNDEKEANDVKAKGKISVEVKPIDLQVKPIKFQAKISERKSIVTTSTTTEPATTIEPTESAEDESNDKNEEQVKPAKTVKQTVAVKKNDKIKVAAPKPIKPVEKPLKKDAAAASVVITERPTSRKSAGVQQKVEEPKSRRAARGRSRFRSANIETTEQPDEKESKVEKKEEQPKSTKRDKVKPENAEVKEKKNEVKKVEKVDKEKEEEQNEKEIKAEAEAKAEEKEENPKPWQTSSVKKLQHKVAAAKNDAEKWKQDKFESKRKNSSKPDKRSSDESEPKENNNDDDDDEVEPAENKSKSRIASPSAEERRKGRKYHDIQIVQLESEIEEDGKYRYNYEGEDGTHVEQEGELKRMNDEDMGESVKGSYSYKDDDGMTYSVSYTADENGYRPVGDHIPTIPPAIARALAWAATAKPWVDPWLVEQKRLKMSRESRKLPKNDQKKNNKNKRVKPVIRNEDENDYDEIEEIESQ